MLYSRYTIGRRSETIFIVFYFIYFFYENDSFPRQWVTIKPRAIGCATGKQKKKNRSGWRGSYTDNDIFRTIKNRTTRIVQYSAGRGDRQRAAEVL